MVKLSLYLFSMSLFIVYVIIPALITILGFEFIIYQSEITHNVLLGNALVSIVPIVFSFIFSSSLDNKIYYFEEHSINDRGFSSIIPISLWIVGFILFNGLNFRDDAHNYGFGLKVCFVLLNTMTVLHAANLIVHKSLHFKILSIKSLLSLLFIMVLIVSGSRGLVFQILLTLVIYSIFKIVRKRFDTKGFISYKVSFTNMKAYANGIKYLILISVLGVFFAIAGVSRDGTTDPIFESVYRLSEPYWYFAYEVSESRGFETNVELIFDSIERITAIFIRGLDYGFSGSLDGKEFYVSQLLKISSSDQVSLPITLIGHGYLISGVAGAVFAVSFASLMIIFIFSIIKKIPFRNNLLKIALMLLIAAKVWNLHAKSISGVVLYLVFETFRDIIIIVVLDRFFVNKNLSTGAHRKNSVSQ